ncbi:MAG: sulfotransferase [bacterium]
MNQVSFDPVFILSTGRCGTLLNQRFFQNSEQVESFQRYRGRSSEYRNDMSFILEQNWAYHRIVTNPDPNPSDKRTIIDRLRRARKPLIDKLAREGRGFLETNHGFAAYAPLMLEAYPEARFVHLVRHPRNVVASFMRKFDPPPMSMPAYFGTRYSFKGQLSLRFGYVEALAKWCPQPLRKWLEELKRDRHIHPFEKENGRWVENTDMSAFEKTCWYWNAINELVHETLDSLDDDRSFLLHSEDLFSRNKDTLKRYMEFLNPEDLDVEDLLDFLDTRVNPKEIKNDFPEPRDWTPEMNRTLFNYCGDTMRTLDYDPEQLELGGKNS